VGRAVADLLAVARARLGRMSFIETVAELAAPLLRRYVTRTATLTDPRFASSALARRDSTMRMV
jgi:hypothetical protein